MHRLDFHSIVVTKDQSRRWKKINRSQTLISGGTLIAISIVVVIFTVSQVPLTNSIKEVMRQTGVSSRQAVRAIELARLTNARGQVILSEAIDKANTIKAAGATDSPVALKVRSIAFTAVGGETRAVINPAVSGVSVQRTVSGTDGYYMSTTQQTDAAGQVSFNIPRAKPTVVDTISVSVVLNGKTAKTTYIW